MGHRTLVAYERDGYDLHYAHWGVDPAAITPETPFGERPATEWARSCSCQLVEPEGGELTVDRETAVDSDPLATELSFPDVCERVDPLEHEALYVVDEQFSVRTYLVFAIGVDGEAADACGRPTGALVAHDGESDATYLRGWLAGARAVRDVADLGTDAVVRALRWLDPDRGAIVWIAGGREA